MKTTTFKALISDNNDFGINGITIPRIQRAYAQGRNDAHAVKTRERFLSAIYSGLEGNGLTLDFIYGNVQKGQLIPLDGQQRLTTLWLLHWYAARKEEIEKMTKGVEIGNEVTSAKDNEKDNKDNVLTRFSYHTRYSAREFLVKLVAFRPSFKLPLSKEIRNQGWYPMDWENDPTVSGMLTMLDEIQTRFKNIENLWDKLDKINFYFRNIEEMKLTDDIYIKMNSRGKPLTDFEHFKAELLKVIRSENEQTAKRIGLKIDREWTDLLWNYRDNDNLVDNGFLRFFRFISLILIYKSDRSASEFDLSDDFKLLERIYSGKPQNVAFLEKAFDCMVDIHSEYIDRNREIDRPVGVFFEDYLSSKYYLKGKVVLPQQISHCDLFEGILVNAALRRNTTYWVTLFYAFLFHLINKNDVEDTDFRRRLRVIVNLLKNSRNEVVDTPNGDAGNRMPAILKQVENIISKGEIAESIKIDNEQRQNFNVVQMDEERQKLTYTKEYPQNAEGLFRLEDFHLLDGRVDVVGYENVHLYNPFITLFTSCSRDKIDCAMLSINDYSQRLNHWSIQLGSADEGEMGNKAWHALFHPSGKNLDFEKTKKALRTILEANPIPNDSILDEIIKNYIESCHRNSLYEWRYYYVAYPAFRPARFGRYTMYEGQPYSLVALHAEKRESSNAYQCMLMALVENQAVASSAEWYDTRNLTYKKGLLTCVENAFVSFSLKDDTERGRFIIPQNESNIDTVDRIDFFKEHRRDNEMWSTAADQEIGE